MSYDVKAGLEATARAMRLEPANRSPPATESYTVLAFQFPLQEVHGGCHLYLPLLNPELKTIFSLL